MRTTTQGKQKAVTTAETDPILRHPWLVGLVVVIALAFHPSGIATALLGFCVALVCAEIADHYLRKL